MDLTSDFQAYHDRVTKSLVEVVRTGGQISSSDLSFHRSNDKISRSLDQQNARLLRLTNKLLKAASQDSNVKPPTLRDQDGVDDNWRGVVDVVDDLLEKADASLDEFTGAIRRMSPAQQDGAQTPTKQTTPPISRSSRVQFPKVLHKPQLLFHRKVNNVNPEPFKPLLIEKPHAVKPLEESIGDGNEQYLHPYADEIAQYNFPQRVYASADPIPYTPPEQSSAILVDTEQAILDMLQELKTAKEIAVDLEHHEYRSYYGIVCLMQISTRNKDWIVDTLKPWREKLQILNEVFADSSILKVFHGSSMDMIWLQRDLGLYVVGLFDTYYACEALQFPGRGLKYLLQRFANFEAQKQYQMADWRIRPLPAELIDYARSDTHYLLYVYDILRNMLIENSTPQTNLIDHVLQGSKKEAAQTYVRFVYNKESGRGSHGWYNLFTEYSNRLSTQQFAVFRALHEWRDMKAREDDEGLSYIFPNKFLWALAEHMPINPTELYRANIRPMPASITGHAKEIFDLVYKAKQEAAAEPHPQDFLRLNEDKYGIPHNRWRKPKLEKPQSRHTGLGATLQQLSQNGEVGNGANIPQATTKDTEPATPVVDRAQQSNLWGTITTAMFGDPIETNAAMAALQAILPLPTLSRESFVEINGINTPSPAQLLATPVESTPQQTHQPDPSAKKILNQANDVFTLKQQSRKRKAGDLEDEDLDTELFSALTNPSTSTPTATTGTNGNASPSSPDHPNHVSLNPAYDNKRAAKQKRKAEKRALKAAKQAEAAAQAANMVPFDYANAETLIGPTHGTMSRSPPTDRPHEGKLHRAKQMGMKAARDSKGKPMNPFAKALDTSTGAKRGKMGKELPGKGMTFQS